METKVFAQGTSGISTPVSGASGIAQGNAFVARCDDASAVHFNPAGLTQLQERQVSLGAAFLLPLVEYQDDGLSEDMKEKISPVPNFYFASPIIDNKLAAGLGVTAPYGLQSVWNDDGFARFVAARSELSVISVTPTVAFKPLSFLSVGVGMDYYYADLEQGKHINVSLINSALTGFPPDPSTPEGVQDSSVHGDAFGYNAGMLI
ncbi:MAG: outer membrane protein transport protein, partial [Planctomycetes bacterium]|nr:outer membrane protein transport protein [Planctomycetota bacterium]